jgi:hypothetical protein
VPRLARAVWVRCIGLSTPNSGATWQVNAACGLGRETPITGRASGARVSRPPQPMGSPANRRRHPRLSVIDWRSRHNFSQIAQQDLRKWDEELTEHLIEGLRKAGLEVSR